ncbi:copper resistance protein CopC [Nonomuraea sp. NPDC059194]|uniref:copper resistance CopC family protein n=1 Tax=Nonomuraea sp. NPDC059194 TaxID=3346764 RepID=UPI0036D1F898
MDSAMKSILRYARRFLLVAVCGGTLLMLTSPAAFAHDRLKSSSPAKDAKVAAVKEIELVYTARVRSPTVVLHDAAGKNVSLGKPRASGPKVVAEVDEELQPGVYVIAWRVVSSDGHPIEGEIPFTVAGKPSPKPSPTLTPSSQTPTETPSATPSTTSQPSEAVSSAVPSAAEQQSQGIPAWLWVTGAVLLAIGAGLGLRSRRRGDTEPTE